MRRSMSKNEPKKAGSQALKTRPTGGADRPLDIALLHAAIPRLTGKNVLVVGDVMLDQYIFGVVERISPEAPVPVVQVEREEFHLGGASNVARNIVSLGGRCLLMGFLGDDSGGRRVRLLLDDHGIVDQCLTEKGYNTTTKTRVIAQHQQVVRIDRESDGASLPDNREAMIEAFAREIRNCSVVIISDYGKGLVTEEFVALIRDECNRQKHRPPVLVDPKPKNYQAYRGVHMLTPNTREAGVESGAKTSLEDIVVAGERLRRRLESTQLLITLGPQGMMLLDSPDTAVHIPTAARKVYDVTGAGDTVIAVLGLALAAGLSSLEGCLLANYAAGLVVGQVGAAAVDQRQLDEALQSWPVPKLQRIPVQN